MYINSINIDLSEEMLGSNNIQVLWVISLKEDQNLWPDS